MSPLLLVHIKYTINEIILIHVMWISIQTDICGSEFYKLDEKCVRHLL